jgi:hypothetical protein
MADAYRQIGLLLAGTAFLKLLEPGLDLAMVSLQQGAEPLLE